MKIRLAKQIYIYIAKSFSLGRIHFANYSDKAVLFKIIQIYQELHIGVINLNRFPLLA